MDIVEMVTQMGFPIAACLGLFYLYDKSIKNFTETLGKMETLLEETTTFVRKVAVKIETDDKENVHA